MFLKTETYAKIFFLVSFTGIVIYIVLAFNTYHTAYSITSQFRMMQERVQELNKPSEMKYILIWNINRTDNFIGEGSKPFTENNCTYQNCFVTIDQDYLGTLQYAKFDAVIFESAKIAKWRVIATMPHERSPHQKYIFHSLISSSDATVCNINADSYFNWTWTYRLDSDIPNPFIEVTDENNNFIAPTLDVEWKKNITFVSSEVIKQLKGKTKAVAWIVRRCITKNERLRYARQLMIAVRRFGLDLDVYGGCNGLSCPNHTDVGCLKIIEKDYYFYLAFEDSYEQDYVTKEVILAYSTSTIPIVVGSADYTNFLPPESYLHAYPLNVEKLAAQIDYTIRHPEVYFSYFKWKNHYTIREFQPRRSICQLCELLNTKKFNNTVYKQFRTWWYKEPLNEKCFPKGAEHLDTVLSYMNDTKNDGKYITSNNYLSKSIVNMRTRSRNSDLISKSII